MKTILLGWVVRLVVGSFFVFAVRSLAGKTALQPVLGLASTCLMTVLLLQPAFGNASLANRAAYAFHRAQQEIVYSIQMAQNSSRAALYEGVAAELAEQMESEGIFCTIRLEEEENGALAAAKFWCDKGQAEKAADRLSGLTGLEETAILYMGETCDGDR